MLLCNLKQLPKALIVEKKAVLLHRLQQISTTRLSKECGAAVSPTAGSREPQLLSNVLRQRKRGAPRDALSCTDSQHNTSPNTRRCRRPSRQSKAVATREFHVGKNGVLRPRATERFPLPENLLPPTLAKNTTRPSNHVPPCANDKKKTSSFSSIGNNKKTTTKRPPKHSHRTCMQTKLNNQ